MRGHPYWKKPADISPLNKKILEFHSLVDHNKNNSEYFKMCMETIFITGLNILEKHYLCNALNVIDKIITDFKMKNQNKQDEYQEFKIRLNNNRRR